MPNVNKVIQIGHLTRDPQLSYTPSNTAVVEFGLANNRRWKGQDGVQKEDTCFLDCKAFGKSAETLSQYLKKGDPVYIEGRLDFSSWEAQDGSKRSKLRVVVEQFQFLPRSNSDGGGGQQKQEAAPPQQQQTQTAPPADDDLPF